MAETGLVDVIDVPIKDTWAAMERLVEQGKIRSIGVSELLIDEEQNVSSCGLSSAHSRSP